MKNAGKACNNRLYRHIRTFEKIIKNYFVILHINIILHAHGKAVEPAARKQKYCRFLKFFRVHNLFSKKVLTNQAVGYNINTVVSTQVPRVLIHQNQNSKAVEKDDRRTARHNIIFDNRQLY